MEWIKITDKTSRIPKENFLATDGKSIAIKHNSQSYGYFVGEGNLTIDSVTHYILLENVPLPNQPERSKREDSQQCEMRCSEHCGNTVRDK